MGTRPNAGIFLSAPVNEVVLALRARPRVVGNFIGRQAELCTHLLRHIVESACHSLIRNLQLARGVQAEERRLRFDGELVERQMLGGFRHRELQLVFPHLRGLVRPRIDQIEGIAVERRARDGNRIQCFARCVQTAQCFQGRIVQRLHAERHTIHTRRAITLEPRRFHTGRIGFQCNFDVGRDGPMLGDGIEDRADGLRLHQRWRAAAQKDRRDLAARSALRRGFDLALEGAGKAEFVNRRVADMAVEVAIRTLRQAERPVHVDAKSFFRAAAHVRHISASFTKAFARWERPMPCGGRPCFSMLVISPKVRL